MREYILYTSSQLLYIYIGNKLLPCLNDRRIRRLYLVVRDYILYTSIQLQYIYIGNKGLPGKRFGIPLTTHVGILFF